MSDGGYYGVPDVIIPFRKPVYDQITDWQQELNAVHRRVRARIKHALAQIKTWKSFATIGERPGPSPSPRPESPISALSPSPANQHPDTRHSQRQDQ
jgi:hypothetical protein